MSEIIKTEAIVLRSIKYSETSKIVTFYTKELGRVGAIVKGVRKREGKHGSILEPMSYLQLVLYMKESREVQTVGQYDIIKSFHHISTDLEKISVGLSLLEIVNAITHELEQNESLFNLLQECLVQVDDKTLIPSLIYFYFQVKLVELLGFAPVFDSCNNCKNPIPIEKEGGWQSYNLLRGSPTCDSCSQMQDGLIKISTQALRHLQKLRNNNRVIEICRNQPEFHIIEEIEGFLVKYLQTHVTGYKSPRARKMFNIVSHRSDVVILEKYIKVTP